MQVERLFEHLEELEYAGEWPPRIGGLAAQLAFESPVVGSIHFEDEAR